MPLTGFKRDSILFRALTGNTQGAFAKWLRKLSLGSFKSIGLQAGFATRHRRAGRAARLQGGYFGESALPSISSQHRNIVNRYFFWTCSGAFKVEFRRFFDRGVSSFGSLLWVVAGLPSPGEDGQKTCVSAKRTRIVRCTIRLDTPYASQCMLGLFHRENNPIRVCCFLPKMTILRGISGSRRMFLRGIGKAARRVNDLDSCHP